MMDLLPVELLAAILSLTTPKDVKKLAAVSKVFLDASKSDTVWEKFLPPHRQKVYEFSAPLFKVYDSLCNGVYQNNNSQLYTIDKATGSLIRELSARAITIMGSEKDCHWDWIRGNKPHNGCSHVHSYGDPYSGYRFMITSKFEEIAFLKGLWWLELQGQIRESWPVGRYSVSFRLQFVSKRRITNPCDSEKPVIFALSKDSGIPHVTCTYPSRRCVEGQELPLKRAKVRDITDLPENRDLREYDVAGWANVRDVGNGWEEYCIGEFSVEDEDACVDLRFSMLEVGGEYHCGLYVDGVIIRASV